ncbi:AzlC family ABC transporter permease [Demequina sp. B12]|uniref:AzlC family ABC transporter permease n=1 Tax=Demequina sp. B12 TaxID=2992757 RepID=UPI00237AEEBE|nr:AzlC family ABC transporter permease [Demequina sp. B12]MDE0571873.1 AzlC family ABC transporter permease [Demequina sp. B12]
MTESPTPSHVPGEHSGRTVLRIGPQQWRDLWHGTRAIAPLMPGAVVFGLAFGALISEVGLPLWLAPYASSTVTAGASQIAIVEALRQGAPALIAIATALVINARLALYSAAMAPIFAAFPRRWKAVLAYLMTDQSAAVSAFEAHRWPDPVRRRWFILGVSGPFVAIWIAGTAAGAILGPVIPDAWQIGFIVPLMFIAVMVPAIRSWPAVAAAGIAATVVLILKDLPYGLNVLIGALVGIAIASFVPDRAAPGGSAEPGRSPEPGPEGGQS